MKAVRTVKMKKIGIYVGVLGDGGIEYAVVSQLEHLHCSCYTYDIIIDDTIANHILETRILSLGYKIQTLGVKFGARMYKLKKYLALRKMIRENDYCCVHFHFSFPSSLLYTVITSEFGINSIVTSHASGPAHLSLANKIEQSVARKVYPCFCTYRIAVSELAGNWMFGNYAFDIIPNAIAVDKYKFNEAKRKSIRKSLGISDNALVIGHVGRFVPEKNHEFLVNVFSVIKKKAPATFMILIGDGINKDLIHDKIKSQRLDKSVFFVERTNRVEDFLCAMDCFVFPSVREGFGIVLLEAQASNLPVVSSNMVPKETKVSELISFLPLEAGATIWAEKVMESRSSDKRRNQAISPILLSDYSLSGLAKRLLVYYGSIVH